MQHNGHKRTQVTPQPPHWLPEFWVLASAEADVKGSVSSERARTQQLTLTLKPRVEQAVIDEQGQRTTLARGVDVEGPFVPGEEQPSVPPAGGY